MKIRKVWAMYFSPTGTTEKTVTALASEIAKMTGAGTPDIFDFTLPDARKSFPEINCGEQGRQSDRCMAESCGFSGLNEYDHAHSGSGDAPQHGIDLVVLGVPTYAGRIPNVLLKYLSSICGSGALAVAAVTFGNRNFDNSLIELRDILENGGFHTIGACAMSCEHSFSYSLGAGRPDDRDMDQIKRFARDCASKAMELTGLCPPIPVDGIPGGGNDPKKAYGGYYTPRDRNGISIDIRKVTPKISPACTGCGLCASVCPMGSVSREAVTVRHTMEMTGICIKCGACFKKCPVSAVYFDDPGYLYHKNELEEIYGRRAANHFYL